MDLIKLLPSFPNERKFRVFTECEFLHKNIAARVPQDVVLFSFFYSYICPQGSWNISCCFAEDIFI